MKLSTLRRVLVVAPHPDDEIIGCGGLLAQMQARQCHIRVIVMTDGTASHRNSVSYPARRLAKLRRTETRHALRRLGISASDIIFAGFEDGAAKSWSTDCAANTSLRRSVSGSWQLVVGPSIYEAHPDHRQTAMMLQNLRRDIPYAAYVIWPASNHRLQPVALLSLGRARARKRSVLNIYRSQRGLISDDPDGFALGASDLRCFVRPSETYFNS